VSAPFAASDPAVIVLAGTVLISDPDSIHAEAVPASTHQAAVTFGGFGPGQGLRMAFTRPALEALKEALEEIRLCAGCRLNVAVGEWDDAWWCEDCWPDDTPEPTYRGK
jgi:hypothetical protein